MLRKYFSKWKIDDVTRNTEEWITDIKLLRGYLQKLYVQIDDSEMMTHILSNLPEECQIILEILEDELYDKDKPINIKGSMTSFRWNLTEWTKI